MFYLMGNTRKSRVVNYGQMNLMNALRKLWFENVMWTRLYMVSALSELPDLENSAERLFRTPSDFAVMLEFFYGGQKADAFRSLLEEHLKIYASIVDNAKVKNIKAMEQYGILWCRNADRLAAFLAGINPCWPEDEWKKLMHEYLEFLTDVVTSRMTGEFCKDVMLFDQVEGQALAMADVMAAGMIRQFEI